MFNWKNLSLVAGVAILAAVSNTACSNSNKTAAVPTPQGSIPLEVIRVGMPETTFKDAILTFVQDPSGSMLGKVQYLSRGRNANGGQYSAQCRAGQCYGILVYFRDQALNKDVALAEMEKLLPSDKPAQSKVDESSNVSPPTETYYFGDKYKGQLIYTDKNNSKVGIVAAWFQKEPT